MILSARTLAGYSESTGAGNGEGGNYSHKVVEGGLSRCGLKDEEEPVL